MTRRDPVDALLDLIDQAVHAANATHVGEGEARRWSPVAAAAEQVRADRRAVGEAVYDYRETRELAVVAFRHMFQFPLSWDPEHPDVDEIRERLAGHDLACWCPLDQPCHADVLLELANS